jgi:undecaprenyl-diphosphatase
MNAPAAPAPRPSPPRHGPGPWGWTVLLALGLAAARIAYLVWLCPYELAGDEAHYWEWSRRLDLSYYSKGPGVAWVVAASTRVFGLHDWSIRLPAVVATLLSMLAIGRLGRDLAGGSDRAGAYAALGFALTPIFIGTSHFMTIDPPYLTCWIAAAWAAWRVYARARLGHWALAHWALFGLAAGIGFLFKYTILLLIPGVLCFAWRHGAEWPRRRVLVGALVALAVLGIAALPVLLWNHAHGWPTLAHLIGNVRLPGGDVVPRSAWGFKVLWPLSYLASPLILLGPLGVLLVAAVLWRNRRAPAPSPATEFAVCCALPVLGFYLVVSLATDVELNWPIAGFTTLGLPVARALAGIPVPPSRAIRNLWRGFAAFGMVALPVIAFTPTLIRAAARLPALGPHIPVEPLTHRVAGHRAFADRVSHTAAAHER